MYYAGIGSREIPEDIRISFEKFGKFAQDRGLILRTGGAEGAEAAFEKYVSPSNKEVFLPWENFNGNNSKFNSPSRASYLMAAKFHPNWSHLSVGVQKLFCRTIHQFLGNDLKSPVEFVLCWTENGDETGGAGQGLKLAQTLDIPIFNFGSKQFAKKQLLEFVLDLTEEICQA